MNPLTITFLTGFLTVVFVTAGRELGGPEGALVACILALLVHGTAYWFSDRIALHLYGAREMLPGEAPWLRRIVEDLTLGARMPMPKLYWLPRRTTTAFATGRNGSHAAVAVTKDIQNLGGSKLRDLLDRELSQVKRRDRLFGTIAAGVIGALSVLANIGE